MSQGLLTLLLGILHACIPELIAEEVKASNQQECTLTGKLTLLVSFSLELPEYLKRLMCSSSTFGRR